MPKVSVLITLFNKAAFVEEAVHSILTQSYVDLEVLIVDDASTDGGLDKVRRIDDPRIRILESAVNTGRPAAANRGYNAARGEYVAVLDADDIAMPDRLARQVAYLDAHPAVGILGSFVESFGSYVRRYTYPAEDAEAQARWLFDEPAIYGGCMFRRSVIEAHVIRCDEQWHHQGMDILFLLELSRHTRISNIQEVLTLYRVGPQNMRHGRDQYTERGILIREKFKRFGSPISDTQLGLHLLLIGMLPEKVSVRMIWELKQWVRVLESDIRSRGLFDRKEFEVELHRRWKALFNPLVDRGAWLGVIHMVSLGEASFAQLRYLLGAFRRRLVWNSN